MEIRTGRTDGFTDFNMFHQKNPTLIQLLKLTIY